MCLADDKGGSYRSNPCQKIPWSALGLFLIQFEWQADIFFNELPRSRADEVSKGK
jgi:hypothetical protein